MIVNRKVLVRFISTLAVLMMLASSMVFFTPSSASGIEGDIDIPWTSAPTREASLDGDSWPMYMGDENHTGYSPSLIPPDNTTLWTADIPGLKEFDSPILYDSIVFIGSGDGHMRGLDPDNGDVVWDHYIGNYHISVGGTARDGVIYFGADNGHFYAVDIDTNTRLWDTNLHADSIISTSMVAAGKVFVGTSKLINSTFYALNANDGSVNWTLTMGDQENFWGFQSNPAFHDGRLYISDGWGTFYCLDSDGFFDGDQGYSGESNKSVGNADILWLKEDPDTTIQGHPLLAEGNVFYGNSTGIFFCLDALTGAEIWSVNVGSGAPPKISSCPSYHNGTIYLTTKRAWGLYNAYVGGSVYAFDSTDGSSLWRFNTTGEISRSSPIVGDGVLLFGNRENKVYCISTTTLNVADEDRLIWQRNIGSKIDSTLAVGMGRVFISRKNPSNGGKVIAIGSPDMKAHSIELNDPAPFEGENVQIALTVLNNGTVGATVSVVFRISTPDFLNQKVVGMVSGLRVEPGEEAVISQDWVAETGYPLIVGWITEVSPKDKVTQVEDNMDSMEMYVRPVLTGFWTSAGGGPGHTGWSQGELQSNRTYWSHDLGADWSDPAEPLWLDSQAGSGTSSAVGSALFLTTPQGDLTALNTSTDGNGGTGRLWTYTNASSNLIGRPALHIENEQSWSFANKVFAVGDDQALWAFDWIGFWDGVNDGAYQEEEETGITAGDVIWRKQLPSPVAAPIMIAGGNVLVITSDGNMTAYDDDDGSARWKIDVGMGHRPIAASLGKVYVANGYMITIINANTGSLIRTMDLSTIFSTDILSLSYLNGKLVVGSSMEVAVLDSNPDDNEDGTVDAEDVDDGAPDNITGVDLIWRSPLPYEMITPPAVSEAARVISMQVGGRILFMYLNNGTIISNLSMPLAPVTRAISGGSSFYTIVGADPWVVTSYSPDGSGGYEVVWTLPLDARPRGEPSISKKHMAISLSGGRILSIGDRNLAPVAVISSPDEALMAFPEETITLNASLSFDGDGDHLTYLWYLEGEDSPIYEGPDAVTEVNLEGVGTKKLTLRVLDEMRASGEAHVNVTLLKRVSEEFSDFYYGIVVEMSFGISEPNGRGLVDITIPEMPPEAPGAIFVCHLEFTPLPTYASYLLEWVNVTMEYTGKEFPVRMHEDLIKVYRYHDGAWGAPLVSGGNLEEGVGYGNFSELTAGYYAVGIMDNDAPNLRHRPESDVAIADSNAGMEFRVEYKDPDGEPPIWVRLVIEGGETVDLSPEGIVDPIRYSFYGSSPVDLDPGPYTYYFEADDGHFIARTGDFSLIVENRDPVISVKGPETNVIVGSEILFDASGTTDPDDDDLTFIWDFDVRDGLQRDQVGEKAAYSYPIKGVYIVTLRVSDGTVTVNRTMTITVVPGDSNEATSEISMGLVMLIGLVLLLVVAVVVFLVLSRKGSQEIDQIDKDLDVWSCPECGSVIRDGLDECDDCGYLYDPLDFKESSKDELSDDFEDGELDELLEE